jgi:hypothetical protein
MPPSSLPDPAERFVDVPRRRVPSLELGIPVPIFRGYHGTSQVYRRTISALAVTA